MYRLAISAAAAAAAAVLGGPGAYAQEAQPSPQCAALAKEADETRNQAGSALTRKAGGLLANVAGRALAYAPAIDVGDSVLGRAAGQAVEGAAYEQAASGLDLARQNGQAADAKAAKARLREIRKAAAELNCPKV